VTGFGWSGSETRPGELICRGSLERRAGVEAKWEAFAARKAYDDNCLVVWLAMLANGSIGNPCDQRLADL
jgi:hypothetical protein